MYAFLPQIFCLICGFISKQQSFVHHLVYVISTEIVWLAGELPEEIIFPGIVFLQVLFFFLRGGTQLVLRVYSCLCSGITPDRTQGTIWGCRKFSGGWHCAGQVPFPMYYHSGLFPFSFLGFI